MSAEKLMQLRVCCTVLAHFPADGKTRIEATALARELFPPMAKPLVWVDHRTHSISNCGHCIERQSENKFKVYGDSDFGTLEHCKAVCEAENQARFKEQLA